MKRAVVLILLAAAIAWAGSASAQTLTGTITGKVTDEQGGVLPGVTVTLTGSQGAQTQVTDARGEYRFIGLPPGTYSVKSEIQGFRPKEQTNIALGIGKTIEVALQMTVGGVTEQVDVVANAVVIDTTSTATDTNLSPTLLQSIPMSHAQAQNLLNYAPGINDRSAFGGATSGNALMLDGVDTRDPTGGTPWMFFDYNLLDEVQVGGIGQPAEYGGFTGAMVNSITKSGGNRFSFLSEFRYTSKGLSGDNTDPAITAVNPGLTYGDVMKKMTDYSVQLGGPVQKDKLFFFTSLERWSINSDPTGPRTRYIEIMPRGYFKLTAQASRSDRVTFSVQYDQTNRTGRTGMIPSSVATDSQTRTQDAPDWYYNAQYQKVINPTTFVEAKFMGYTGYYDLTPLDMTIGHYDTGDGSYGGGASWISQHDRSRNQLNVALSKYADLAGKHTFKFGMEIERSTVRERFEYAGGMYFLDYYGAPYYAMNYSYDIKGKNTRESFYGQDQWKMGRFTANVGLRADRIGGISASTGRRVYSTFSLGPRLGAVYDLSGKGTSVLRAFYGHLYEGASVDAYYRTLPGLTDTTWWYVLPGWKLGDVSEVIPAVNKYRMGTDLKQPRTDEISVAWEHQVARNVKFSATGIFRNSKNFINSVLIGGLWSTATLTPSVDAYPGVAMPPAGPVTFYKWANKASIPQQFLIQNVDSVTYQMADGTSATTNQSRKYKGLMLVLTRSLANRWNTQISYVLSKTEGNVSNTGLSGIKSSQFETPNAALINAFGLADYDRRHEIKLMAGYQIPRVEMKVSGYFSAMSGLTYTPYVSIAKSRTNWSGSVYPNLEPRGSRRLPWNNLLTLRAEKVFDYGLHRFGLYVDISNALNAGTVTWVVDRATGTSVDYQAPDGTIQGVDLPFGTPTSLAPARQATIGLRWSF